MLRVLFKNFVFVYDGPPPFQYQEPDYSSKATDTKKRSTAIIIMLNTKVKELKLSSVDKENVPTQEGQPDMAHIATALPQKCDYGTETKQPVKVTL